MEKHLKRGSLFKSIQSQGGQSMNTGTIKMILKALEVLASIFLIFKKDEGGKKHVATRSAKKK